MAQIKKLSTELQPLDKLLDSSGDAGTSGQILSSTGSGTNWISASSGTITGSGTTGYIPKWTGSSALGDSILEVNSALPSSVIIPEYLRHRGDTNTYFGFHSNDTFIVATNNNEVMRVNSTGNVGIGTASPTTKLEINADDDGTTDLNLLNLKRTWSSGTSTDRSHGIKFSDYNSTNALIYADRTNSGANYNSDLIFHTNTGASGTNVEAKMIIKNSGYVGVGTMAPATLVEIADTTNPNLRLQSKTSNGANSGTLEFRENDTNYGAFVKYNGDANIFQLGTRYGGSDYARMTILRDTGYVGVNITSPPQLLTISGDANYIAHYDGSNYAFMLGADSSGDGNFELFNSSGTKVIKIYAEANAANYINNGGNVGIGTTSPGAKFNVQGSSTIGWSDLGNAFILAGTTGAGIGIDSNEIASKGDNLYFGTIQNHSVIIRTNGVNERMRVTNAGNVGIATINPNEKLEVSGNIRTSGSYKVGATEVISSGRRFFAADGSTSAPAYSFSGRTDTGMYAEDHGSNDRIRFAVDGTNRFFIDGNGINIAAGNLYLPSGNSVRNYSGVWQATTGTSGNGFIFTNTADSAEVLSITSSSSGATASIATFGGKARSQQTASGDDAATLTTKGYVDGLVTGVTRYMGLWDASDGTGGSPDLTASTYKVPGYYFIVSVAGDAEPNGAGTEPDTWHVGDWVIWSDQATDAWQKIDNTSVLSGTGTANKVAMWNGDESLTDAPITISTNDATFAANVSASSFTGQLQGAVTGAPDATIWRVSGEYPNWGIFYDQGTPDEIQFKASGTITSKIILDTGGAMFSGDVGIGGSPGAKFDVNAGTTNTVAIFESTDDKAFIILKDDDTSTHLITRNNTFSIGESSTDYDNFKVDITTGDTTIAGDILAEGGDITVKDTGTENAMFRAYATGTGYAGIIMDASNGDGSGSDYFTLRQLDNKQIEFNTRVNAGNTLFYSKGSLNLTQDGANSTFAGTLTVEGADAITIPDYILHAGDDSKFGFPSNDNFKIRLAGSDLFTMSTTTSTFEGLVQVNRDSADIPSSTGGHLYLVDTRSLAANTGGAIVFSSYYQGTTPVSGGSYIKGYKENATSGDYGYGLKFGVRENGEGLGGPCLTLNSSGNATFTGSVTINSDSFSLSGNAPVMTVASSNQASGFRINVTGLDNDGDDLFRVQDSGNTRFTIKRDGDVTFTGDISIPLNKRLYFGGGSHTYISEDIDDRLRFFVGGAEFLRFTEDTADTIFICQNAKPLSDSAIDLGSTTLRYANLWVDSINGSTPTTGGPYLPISAGISYPLTGDLYLDDGSGASPSIYLKNGSDNYWRLLNGSTGILTLKEGTTDRLTFAAGGNATFSGNINLGRNLVFDDATGGFNFITSATELNIGPTGSAHDATGYANVIYAGSPTPGTTNDIAGGHLWLAGGAGKGTGAGGDIIFRVTPPASTSGSSLNDYVTALTISDDKSASFAGDIIIPDEKQIELGNTTGGDLRIYHSSTGGNSSSILNITGDLEIKSTATDGDIAFRADDGTGGFATYFYLDGGRSDGTNLATRWNDGSIILLGSGTGWNDGSQIYHSGSNFYLNEYVGNIEITCHTTDGDIKFKSDNGSGGETEYFRVDGSSEKIIYSKNQWLTDNVRAIFGSGDDLKIFHNGSDSYIENSTGELRIISNDWALRSASSEIMGYDTTADVVRISKNINFGDGHFLGDDGNDNLLLESSAGEAVLINGNTNVKLQDGGNTKLTTTSTGISVTGVIDDRDIPCLFNSNFEDAYGTTIIVVPFNNNTEANVSTRTYNHNLTMPYAGKLTKIVMKHVSGSLSSGFTTQLFLYVNGSQQASSSELPLSNSSVTWTPTTNNTFSAGDVLSFAYQKSALKTFGGVSFGVAIELTDYDI